MYNLNDTIVAIATGPQGAIAIVRVSGRDAFKISSNILSPNQAFIRPLAGQSYLLKIIDENNNIIDRAMVITYISPRSFTGEDMVEIFTHNSPYVVKKTLELFIKNGARDAQPGEFSFRAFINGKIDLVQAEAINELIKAETEKQHKIAISQLNGILSKRLNNIKDNIIQLLAEVEVRIDDSYEEMEDIDKELYTSKLNDLIEKVTKLSSTYYSSKFIKNGLKITLVGAPNSGKSSLLNKIIGYERSITSHIPGTTRDTIEVNFEINGIKVIFTDTAGIRSKTLDPIEVEGIERTKKEISNSDIIIYLEDISIPQTEDDILTLELIDKNKKKDCILIKVYSKSDLKPIKNNKDYIKVSAITGENIEKLISTIAEFQEKITDNLYDEVTVSYRHYEALEKVKKELNEAKNMIETGNYELVAENLRQALRELEEITGKTTPEDVLEKIFKNFCVGK